MYRSLSLFSTIIMFEGDACEILQCHEVRSNLDLQQMREKDSRDHGLPIANITFQKERVNLKYLMQLIPSIDFGRLTDHILSFVHRVRYTLHFSCLAGWKSTNYEGTSQYHSDSLKASLASTCIRRQIRVAKRSKNNDDDERLRATRVGSSTILEDEWLNSMTEIQTKRYACEKATVNRRREIRIERTPYLVRQWIGQFPLPPSLGSVAKLSSSAPQGRPPYCMIPPRLRKTGKLFTSFRCFSAHSFCAFS